MGIREKSYYYTLQVRNGDQTVVRNRKIELIKADMWIERLAELDEQEQRSGLKAQEVLAQCKASGRVSGYIFWKREIRNNFESK